MVIVVLIVAVIVWLFVHAAMADAGMSPRTRGSLRYQRRKARRLGLDPSDVHVNSRTPDFTPPEPIGNSHVGDLAWSLGMTVLGLVLMFGGSLWIIAHHMKGDLVFVWWGVVILFLWIAGKIRSAGR